MNNSSEINVFWFRRDLNIDENVGLFYALKSKFPVLPIFIFDNDILDLLENKNDKRIDLIFQIVQNIKIKLEKIGSSLLILKGKPIDVFANLTK